MIIINQKVIFLKLTPILKKDASINEKLDRLRLSTTSSLSSRKDIIVVASVSCIYNIGAPENYQNLTLFLKNWR